MHYIKKTGTNIYCPYCPTCLFQRIENVPKSHFPIKRNPLNTYEVEYRQTPSHFCATPSPTRFDPFNDDSKMASSAVAGAKPRIKRLNVKFIK